MDKQQTSIEGAVEYFIANFSSVEAVAQAELRRFERWIGKTRRFSSLGPLDIERYAERLSASDPDFSRKLDAMRKFLAYARDQGWTGSNLAVHLKVKKGKSKSGGSTRTVRPDLAVLTRQGYNDIVKELAGLKTQRPHVLEEIRRAAADKDFRENAPLHAAREQLSHIDGRIQELTAIIKSASIISEGEEAWGRVALGNTVKLVDTASGQSLKYTLVGPKEANPAHGKISHVSPIGKAVLGKNRGDVVEVGTPSGSHHYKIEEIQS